MNHALKKSHPKNSGYTGTTEQDMKNSEQHEVHCCSRFVMSVVQAIGSWLQAVWVMLAPRTAKLSGGLADTAARAFQNSKSSGLMHCPKSYFIYLQFILFLAVFSCKSEMSMSLMHLTTGRSYSSTGVRAHHWMLSDKNFAALQN